MTDQNQNTKPELGQIQIADEVIAVIAGTAAREVDGIEKAQGSVNGAFVDFFGKKNQSKGVRVSVEDGQTSVEIDVTVRYGTKIQEAASQVQKKVKSAIESMTGLEVALVNVNVVALAMEKPKTMESEESET